MTRFLACVVLASSAAVVLAQPPDADPKAKSPPVTDLTVSPAPAPVPALKYELLPRLRDRTPGNAALDYMRAALLLPKRPLLPETARERQEAFDRWMEAPPDKFPTAEVKEFFSVYADSALRALDLAARCERCDWELTRPIRTGHVALIPPVQEVRELARLQALRVRLALAENDLDAAARHLRTGFRLAKDVGESPTLIQMLVGFAITAIVTGEADRFVQRPGAPNLYWALTTLPRPFIDPRPGLAGEAAFFESHLPGLHELEKGPVSADRANQLLGEMFEALRKADPGEKPGGFEALLGKAGLTAYVLANHAGAKKQLVELGRPAAEVEKMPAAQVVALRGLTLARAMSDDMAKCYSLPPPQARAELARVQDRAKKMIAANDGDILVRLVGLTLPALGKVYDAHARVDRRLAGLRAVEAVRMHAAANGGRPPKRLADITLVPIPDDPNTGKPFEYTAEGNKFTLTAPPPTGEDAGSHNSFRYEVTVREK